MYSVCNPLGLVRALFMILVFVARSLALLKEEGEQGDEEEEEGPQWKNVTNTQLLVVVQKCARLSALLSKDINHIP